MKTGKRAGGGDMELKVGWLVLDVLSSLRNSPLVGPGWIVAKVR